MRGRLHQGQRADWGAKPSGNPAVARPRIRRTGRSVPRGSPHDLRKPSDGLASGRLTGFVGPVVLAECGTSNSAQLFRSSVAARTRQEATMAIQVLRASPITKFTDSEMRRRLAALVGGAAAMGGGITLLVWSRLGMVPMDVLHAAVSHIFGWTFGSSILVCQIFLTVTFLPLRIRPGVATVVAFVIPAAIADVLLPLMPTVEVLPLPVTLGLLLRTLAFLLGGLLFCAGVAAYLLTDLGPLPRDGLMLVLAGARHGISHAQPRRLALARIGIDTAWVAGGVALLGPANAVHVGALAPGTLFIAAGSGPLIACLRRRIARVPGFPAARASQWNRSSPARTTRHCPRRPGMTPTVASHPVTPGNSHSQRKRS